MVTGVVSVIVTKIDTWCMSRLWGITLLGGIAHGGKPYR
jgi:hypothetical protein